MATHIVSFRIAQDANATERWASTVARIKAESTDGSWDETTSLILIKSEKSAVDLASSIYFGSLLDASKDKLLVVDITRNAYATRGQIDYPATLASFFPVNALRAMIG